MRKAAPTSQASLLRKSILQAAVQGKLVPQNASDEPAKLLLERIKAEKAKLVKEGKLNKEKPLPPIAEEEKPFDLPVGWEWVRLGEICTFVNGDRSSQYPSGTDIVKAGIPFISSKNIINRYVSLVEHQLEFITKDKFDSLRAGKLLDCDIVFVLRGSVGKFGVFHKSEKYDTGFVNAQIVIIRLFYVKFVAYLCKYLDSPVFTSEVQSRTTGSAVGQLSATNLATFRVPLPPLAEQERIVAKVNELMIQCDQLEHTEQAALALDKHFFETLPKSILQAAVQGKLVPKNEKDEPASVLLERIKTEKAKLIKDGKLKKEKPLPAIEEDEKPFALPVGWEWVRLGDICNYGTAQNIAPSEIKDGTWVLELEDIEKETGKLSPKLYAPMRKPQSTKHAFERNNILYSRPLKSTYFSEIY